MPDSPPRTPLVKPKGYFDEADDPLSRGLAAFALYLIGLSVLMYIAVRVVIQHIQSPSAGLESQLMSMLFGTIFFTMVFGCVVLLGIAALLHYGSSKHGDFGDAVAVAAWGYAPNALSLPFSYVLFRRRLDGYSYSIRSPEAMQAEVEAMHSGGSELQILLSLAVIIWSVYILGYGIHSTHGINKRNGLVLAGFIGLFAFLGRFI